MNLRAAMLTDAGKARASNEDYSAVVLPPGLPPTIDALLVVADGMGGHQAGEIASSLAADTVVRSLTAVSLDVRTPSARTAAMQWAVEAANHAVHARGQTNPELRGMGTTCTAVMAAERQLYVGHVGDSRAYVVRGGEALRLTEDHSWVAAQIRLGKLTVAQARDHENRHLLLQAVGPRPEVVVQTCAYEVRSGDIVLLCSDGLTNLVADDELPGLVMGHSPDEGCVRLVACANERGGIDNITAVVGAID